MTEQERPFKERIWEFTKDISVKVSKKAEKHWKINTLRVEIASIKHRINVKYKELGRYVYESFKAGTLEEESHKVGSAEMYVELKDLEAEIVEREQRIEMLEQESMEETGEEAGEEAGEEDQKPPASAPSEQEAQATSEEKHAETPPLPTDKGETDKATS